MIFLSALSAENQPAYIEEAKKMVTAFRSRRHNPQGRNVRWFQGLLCDNLDKREKV